MTKPILLAGGRVLDPSQNIDRVADVLIVDGKVELIGERVANDTKNRDGLETIDCAGLVVSPASPRELGAAVNRLLANRQEREAFGRNARKRYLEHFTADAMIARYAQEYHQIAAEHATWKH